MIETWQSALGYKIAILKIKLYPRKVYVGGPQKKRPKMVIQYISFFRMLDDPIHHIFWRAFAKTWQSTKFHRIIWKIYDL